MIKIDTITLQSNCAECGGLTYDIAVIGVRRIAMCYTCQEELKDKLNNSISDYNYENIMK